MLHSEDILEPQPLAWQASAAAAEAPLLHERKEEVSEKKKKRYGTKKKTQNSPSLAALSLARTACSLIIKPTKPNAASQTRYTFLLSELFPLFQNPLSSVPLSFSVSLCFVGVFSFPAAAAVMSTRHNLGMMTQ
jgi:hypothetical protein